MNEKLIKILIEKLEIRMRQFENGATYPLHSGHHTRDVTTVLAVLKNHPLAEKLLENMPKEEDSNLDKKGGIV